MPDQRGVGKVVLVEEGFDVVGERGVVMDFFVGGFAVVACVDCVDGAGEDACKGTGELGLVGVDIGGVKEVVVVSYFPTL